MEKILIVPLLIGFFASLFFTPVWIRKAKQIGLLWENMHKKGHPKNLAGSGGIIVLMSFCTGVLTYIAIKTFILKTNITTIEIFALLTTVLLAGIIGFIDDLCGWAYGGLSKRFRILLLVFTSIPLVVINAGSSLMMNIELGLFYPLVFIPLGIVGATATFNFLEGYNGLGASQGILILSALSVATFLTGSSWLSLICLIMVAGLLGFYLFNKYPAKVLPGDVMTYSVGAMIASVAILGNIEKIAVWFFVPYIIEFFLKSRGKYKKQSIAKLNEKGGLDMPYKKFYGLEHIAIYILKKFKKEGEVHEREVVYLINCFQVLVIVLGFALFGRGWF